MHGSAKFHALTLLVVFYTTYYYRTAKKHCQNTATFKLIEYYQRGMLATYIHPVQHLSAFSYASLSVA